MKFKAATMTVEYKGKLYTEDFKWFEERYSERYMKSWLKDALCAIIHGEIYNEKNFFDEKIRKQLKVISFQVLV